MSGGSYTGNYRPLMLGGKYPGNYTGHGETKAGRLGHNAAAAAVSGARAGLPAHPVLSYGPSVPLPGPAGSFHPLVAIRARSTLFIHPH